MTDDLQARRVEAAEESIERHLEKFGVYHIDPEHFASIVLSAADAVGAGEWRPVTTRPNAGRKIVALYGDGSGAKLAYRFDGGYVDEDGDEHYSDDWLDDACSCWTYLPAGFELWCEIRSEPYTLPAPPKVAP